MVSLASPQADKTTNKALFVLLALTLALTLWTAQNGDDATSEDVVELAKPKVEVKKATHSVANQTHDLKPETKQSTERLIPWQSLNRELPANRAQDAFKVHSWQPVLVVKKLKPEPPPPPVAPPAPFEYIGKLEGAPNQASTIFLMSNNKLHSVAIGANVNPQWRLDGEDANTLRLTYLPLKLTQTLSKLSKAPTNTSPIVAESTIAEPAAEINE